MVGIHATRMRRALLGVPELNDTQQVFVDTGQKPSSRSAKRALSLRLALVNQRNGDDMRIWAD